MAADFVSTSADTGIAAAEREAQRARVKARIFFFIGIGSFQNKSIRRSFSDICHKNRSIIDTEVHIKASKTHPVDSLGIMLIMRARILSKDLFEGLPLGRRKRSKKGLIALHAKFGIRSCGKAAPCLRTSIGVRDIGLDIIDRRAAHQISSPYNEKESLDSAVLDFYKFYKRESQGIGPKRRAGGKNAEPFIAAKAGRTHRRGPSMVL
jgi:hypothetical protein